jgi:hypothetical protein
MKILSGFKKFEKQYKRKKPANLVEFSCHVADSSAVDAHGSGQIKVLLVFFMLLKLAGIKLAASQKF